MALLRIPDDAQIALSKISALSDDGVKDLLRVIEKNCERLSNQDFSSKLASQITTFPQDHAEAILEALSGLVYLVAMTDDRTVKEVVQDVISALQRSSNREVKAALKDVSVFENRLNQLLSVRAFETAAKGFDLLTDHQHVLTGARVLTDVRPVFGHDVDDSPIAAVIVHNLKLNYMDDERQMEFFLALDHRDVDVLIKVLQRAQKKDAVLRKLLVDMKLHHLDPHQS